MKLDIETIVNVTIDNMFEMMPFAVKRHEGEYPVAMTHTMDEARTIQSMNPGAFIIQRIELDDGKWRMERVDDPGAGGSGP